MKTEYHLYKRKKDRPGVFIPHDILQTNLLSNGAILCWGMLESHAGENRECFPKQSTLSKELGTSVRQTQRYLDELEKKEFIKREIITGKNKRYRSTKYLILEPPKLNDAHDINDVTQDDISVTPLHDTNDASQGDINGMTSKRKILKENSKTDNKLSNGASLRNQKEDLLLAQNKIKKNYVNSSLFTKLKPYLKIWADANFKLPGKTTKTMQTTLTYLEQLINGVLLNDDPDNKHLHNTGMNLEEWSDIVANASQSLNSPVHKPINKDQIKKILKLPTFIKNNWGNNGNRFPFLRNLEPPEEITSLLQDPNEQTTVALIGLVNEKYNIQPKDNKEQNKFIESAQRLETYFEEHKNKVVEYFGRNAFERAQILVDAITDDCERTSHDFLLSFVNSDFTFQNRLPKFMKHQSIFREN